jgi:hypothetical protein
VTIERRAPDGAYMFTLMHPERYASLDTYQSRTADFRELVRSMVPDGWTVGEDPGVWCHVESPENQVPASGFKIHVSTRREAARETLRAVVPILVDEGTTFKVLVDEHILELGNSQLWGRAGCGKFITIYNDPNVVYGGEKVGGVRVRPSAPKGTKPEQSAPIDLNEALKAQQSEATQ